MHSLIEEYIRKGKEREQKERDEFLVSLGLFEKEYSDKEYDDFASNNEYNEYPYSEYNAETKVTKRYKKVSIKDVSDEDYREILKYCPKEKKRNAITTVFRVFAWITFILGLIAGIIVGTNWNFALALIALVVCMVDGFIFLGFAEVLQLLTDIKNK